MFNSLRNKELRHFFLDFFLVSILRNARDPQFAIIHRSNDANVFSGADFKVVEFCADVLTAETVDQYRHEERVLIRRRYETAKHRYSQLIKCLCSDTLSSLSKIKELKLDLEKYHKTSFKSCKKMGEVLQYHLELMLSKE